MTSFYSENQQYRFILILNFNYMETDICIMCENDFVIGETGNELGFCCSCTSNKNFPYDLNKYYEDYDNGKVIFKGFETMDRGILKPYKTK